MAILTIARQAEGLAFHRGRVGPIFADQVRDRICAGSVRDGHLALLAAVAETLAVIAADPTLAGRVETRIRARRRAAAAAAHCDPTCAGAAGDDNEAA